MRSYSIKDLEQLSGIKAHTLRIWEQRYNIISPKRTDTNIRYYGDHDLKLVLNISLLKEYGYKISEIAGMGHDDISKEVMNITLKSHNYPDQMNALTIAMIELDEERFEKVMSVNILQLGFEQTMINIIYPFLQKIGILWMTGAISPAHEHFISNLIRQKIIVAIDGQPNHWALHTKKFMLFLPEGELHEISLLFANYLLRAHHHKVVYLGQSLPFHDLESAYEIHQPDFIMSILTSATGRGAVEAYIEKLKSGFPVAKIILTGYQVVENDFKGQFPGIFFLTKINHLVELIGQIKGGAV